MIQKFKWFLWWVSTGLALAQPPNVLLITADDLGWDSLGCTGNPLPNITPNVDGLAAEGLLIQHCHIATPICGPSRHALYTGQYPQRSGYMGHGVQPPTWWKAQNRKVVKKSITSELHAAGYLTGVVGKHGTAWCKFSAPPFGRNKQTGMGRNPAKYYAFVRDFLARAKDENKPFYLAANTHDPHRYWARHPSETADWINQSMGSEDWEALENGKPYPDPRMQYDPADCPIPAPYVQDAGLQDGLQHYYGSVNRMDEVVGQVLRALEESGLAEETLVIFLSDHGMAWDMSKWALYPSGTRTPVIIRWPGKVASGQINSTALLSVVDVAPTIADLCGLNPMQGIDGHSFRCIVEGKPGDWKRRSAFSCFNYMNNHPDVNKMVEQYHPELSSQFDQYRPSRALSTTSYTYIWNGWSDGKTSLPRTMLGEYADFLKKQGKEHADYDARAKFIKQRVPEEFYNTVKDPGCLNNLAANPEYRVVLERYRAHMVKTLENTGDHELENFRSGVMGQR